MPKMKRPIREDPRLVRIRADLKYISEMAGVKIVQISNLARVSERTLQRHIQFPGDMRVSEILAWMDACGAEEFVIRRRD